jgi:NADPH:quinone reductase-like Zn-dependent oxidoreductase
VRDVDVVLDVVRTRNSADRCNARDGGLFIRSRTPAAGADPGCCGDRVRVTPMPSNRPAGCGHCGARVLGMLRPHIAATFPLEEAARAHSSAGTGRTQGKIAFCSELMALSRPRCIGGAWCWGRHRAR